MALVEVKSESKKDNAHFTRKQFKIEIEMLEKTHLTGLSKIELVEFAQKLGEPKFRARQIFTNLQRRRVLNFDEMTDLPKNLREKLNETATLSNLQVESRYTSEDGTRRFLFKTHDNLPVEAVFIPTDNRDTICFSSQSGCPLKCDFCLTAKLGLLRNLTAGEIVEQIITVLSDVYGAGTETPHGTNLVAMGAGEPFLNFDNLLQALRVMKDRDGLFIVPNRVTVSTAGIVPKIRELAKVEDRPHLAISLSAPNDELRDRLMPINKRWNIEELMRACQEFEQSLKPNERFTFEYVMLGDVNDTDEHARQLANLVNRYGFRHVKINLIPHNSAEPLEYRPSSPEQVERFQNILASKGVDAFVRRSRGRDIYAACGQLAAKDAGNKFVQIAA